MKPKFKREDLCTVDVFAYVDPVVLERISTNEKWYGEKKQVYSDNFKAIVLRNGCRIQYRYEVYKFHKVQLSDRKIESMIKYLKDNPLKKYRGWLHHANFYGGISRKFKRQVKIDFDL